MKIKLLALVLVVMVNGQAFGMFGNTQPNPLDVESMEKLSTDLHFHGTVQSKGQFINAAGRFGVGKDTKHWVTVLAKCKFISKNECHCQWKEPKIQNVALSAKRRAIAAMNLALYSEGCDTVTYITSDNNALLNAANRETSKSKSKPMFRNMTVHKDGKYPWNRKVIFKNKETVFDWHEH